MTVVAGGLITLEYAAAGLNFIGNAAVGASGMTARDADLTTYIQAATPIIEDIAGPMLQATVTRKFDGGSTSIVIPQKASSIVSVTEAGNTITDWFFDDASNVIYGGSIVYPRFFYPGRLSMTVTYVVGYATIPWNVQLATRELVRFLWQQGKQAQRPSFGDAPADTGYTPQGFAVPKRVLELLAPNRNIGGFA